MRLVVFLFPRLIWKGTQDRVRAMYPMNLYVFRGLELQTYYPSLRRVIELLNKSKTDIDVSKLSIAYADLFSALLKRQASSLSAAMAEDLLFVDSAVNGLDIDNVPTSLKEAALLDIELLQSIVKRDIAKELSEKLAMSVPSLDALHIQASGSFKSLEEALKAGSGEEVLRGVLEHNRSHGTGLLSKHLAYRFADGQFEVIKHPVNISLSRFIGIDKQLERLLANTQAFLANKPAQHALLYGMRGSGKSSAVRSLLPAYADQGLRMIELAPSHLQELNIVIENLRSRPHKYILFVDDLAFEQNDNGFQPLKTLLEGSLSSPPENMLVYATSNRRHLVKEGFKDRPDPLDDDIHKWDTQNERLALSDRFGLTITFPNMQQRQYLEVVNGLIAQEGLDVGDIKQDAIRFADWGNGYSGRTAQQFIRHLKARI